jgi:hypothetical protein
MLPDHEYFVYTTYVFCAELGIVVYTITHMIGMTSTVTNPILYAFLNENFTKEFRFIFSSIFRLVFIFLLLAWQGGIVFTPYVNLHIPNMTHSFLYDICLTFALG